MTLWTRSIIIRVLLLAGLAAIGWLVFLRRNKLPFHIVTVFGLLIAGAVAIVSPNTTDKVAKLVGVGRGADLVTYISIIAIFFVLVHYYTKFVELQRNVTQLAREMAILRAELDTSMASRPAVAHAADPAHPTSDPS